MRFGKQKLSDIAADLAAVAAAWGLVAYFFHITDGLWAFDDFIEQIPLVMVIVGLANVVWLPLRCIGLLGRLAWRELDDAN